MKYKNLRRWVVFGLLIIFSAISSVSYSQTGTRTRRLPDGTVIYSNGTIKRTDGTIKYPDGRIRQADVSIKYPDGTIRFPKNNNDEKWLPPGQAKKKYGTKSARPFAPGQQMKKNIIKANGGNGRDKNR